MFANWAIRSKSAANMASITCKWADYYITFFE